MEQPNTKDALFRAAVDLFARKGYHGTSVRDLAREVGIKESSVYNHFSSKEAILDAALEYQLNMFTTAARALDGLKETRVDSITDPVEFWLAGTAEFLKHMDETSNTISRILVNEMYLNAKCRAFYLETLLKVRKELTGAIFTEMRRKNMIRDCDIRETAAQYVHMLQGLEIEHTLRMLEGENPATLQTEMLTHMQSFIARLAIPKEKE